jgi:signal transduction histidine kinase
MFIATRAVHQLKSSLKADGHQAVFTVRDFGRGTPTEIQRSQINGNHFGVGLSGMRESVTDLGGNFEIQSDGGGTAITVSIPLAAQISDTETSARKNPAA